MKLARRAAAAALAAAALAIGQTPAARPRLVVDTGSFNAGTLTYSAHKHLLAVGGSATANLYAADTGDELRSFAVADVRGMSFSGDATRLAIADGTRDTAIFDVVSGALLAKLPASAPIALNRDGSLLAGCGQRGPAAADGPTDAMGPCIEIDIWTTHGGPGMRTLAKAAAPLRRRTGGRWRPPSRPAPATAAAAVAAIAAALNLSFSLLPARRAARLDPIAALRAA